MLWKNTSLVIKLFFSIYLWHYGLSFDYDEGDFRMKPYRNLFKHGRIGNLELKIRFVMPPMVTHLSKNEGVTPQLIRYCVERAKSGA